MMEMANADGNTPHLLIVHHFDEEALIRHNLVVDHTERKTHRAAKRRQTEEENRTNFPK